MTSSDFNSIAQAIISIIKEFYHKNFKITLENHDFLKKTIKEQSIK